MKWMIPLLVFFPGSLSYGEVFTVGFENSYLCLPELVEKGMLFTRESGNLCAEDGNGINSVSNGTRMMHGVVGLKFEHTEGKPFTPVSADLAEYSISVGAFSPITFIGQKAGGGTVNFTVTLDNVRDGPGGADDFQTVMFPASFADVLSVQSLDKNYKIDNVVISGHLPPALPPVPAPEPGFAWGDSLWTTNKSNYTVRGTDFFFRVGELAPTEAVYLAPPSPRLFNPGSYASYDAATSTMAFKATNTIQTYAGGDEATTLVTTQQMVDAGFPNYSFHRTAITGGRLIFMAYTVQDAWGLFQLENGVITPRMTMDTDLPTGTGTAKPSYWPDHLAASGNHFAFDTTAAGIRRVYASFNDGPLQLIASVGDETVPFSIVTGFKGVSFNDEGQLEVISDHNSGRLWRTVYNAAGGSVSTQMLTLTIAPVNVGEEVRGDIVSASGEPLLLQTETAIYQESGGKWYRVIGNGDKLFSHTIWYPRFRAARKQQPGHIVVQVQSDIDNLTRTYDIEVLPPVEHAPRFGTTVVHHESGEMYIPLSHLTYGRNYKVRKSTDLVEWEDLFDLGEVLPIQHVVIPPADLGNPSFFRVEEVVAGPPPP